MIHIHILRGKDLETFHESFAVQMNDTHPSIAVAELMRLLVDEHMMDWDRAWEITQQTMAYTNHTPASRGPRKMASPAVQPYAPPAFGDHL